MLNRYESILTKELLEREYCRNGKSISKIASEIKVPRKVISEALELFSIEKRERLHPRLEHHPRWRGVGSMPKTLVNRIMSNAKARGIHFDLSMEELWTLYEVQGGRCALSYRDIDFGYIEGGRLKECSASLDRIDSSQPYVLGNVCWLHKDVNLAKQRLSVSEFLEMCDAVALYNGGGLWKVQYHKATASTRR